MDRKRFAHAYNDIISAENLLGAWREFLKGKRNKRDVQLFQYNLSDNILSLHNDLKDKTYEHGSYQAFNISDSKPRNIHKMEMVKNYIRRLLATCYDVAFCIFYVKIKEWIIIKIAVLVSWRKGCMAVGQLVQSNHVQNFGLSPMRLRVILITRKI